MPLRHSLLAGIVAGAVLAGPAEAQSLSPMRHSGTTPSEIKGYRLTVGNPYKERMTFRLIATEPGFSRAAADAEVNPPEITLAPGVSRKVILAFKIPDPEKERTVGMCVIPKSIKGPILPRVCGTYTGRRAAGAGR